MEIIEKSLVPVLIGVGSWIIKEFVFRFFYKRHENLRTEWERALTKVWSPLFYWSGIIVFSKAKGGWEKHGVKELESILSQNAHLIPLKHYHVLIRLLESATGQKTTPVSIDEVLKTRDFIYKRVELLNFLLNKKDTLFTIESSTDIFSPYKLLLRIMSFVLFHLLIWSTIFVVLGALYFAYINRFRLPIILTGIFILLIAILDVKKRYDVHNEVKKRLQTEE